MEKYRPHILVFLILLCSAGLYLWNTHDKRIFLKKEAERILGMPLPEGVKVLNGEKSELWLEGDVTVFFEAKAKDVEAMAVYLQSVPYEKCAAAKNVPYINQFHPSECYYAEDVNIKQRYTYLFWSLYEHKGVLYWVKK